MRNFTLVQTKALTAFILAVGQTRIHPSEKNGKDESQLLAKET